MNYPKQHTPASRCLTSSCLLLTLAFLWSPSLVATEYYVSTQGSDSNSGTAAQPFRTITHAYSLAGPGTTILVLPGVYTDYQSGWGLHLGSSGTASSPIVLESQVRGGAIIDGQNASDRNVAIYLDGSYNVVEGFGIRNGPNSGIMIWANGNQILNNEIYSNGTPASTSTDGRCGIYSDAGTSDNVYVGNLIYDNGRQGGSGLDHGLYLCGQNELVANNVAYGNDACGLQVAGYTSVSNLRVYNNVFAWNGADGIILWQTLSGVDIENNILYQNGYYGLGSYAATGSGVVVADNIFFGNGAGEYDFTTGGSTYSYTLGTMISANPQFANETLANFDAHLNAGSPAIGAGLNLSTMFTTDLADATRSASAAWDLGAYAYGGSAPTPPAVAMTAPLNNATVSGSITVSASASDTVGVASVQFLLDGTNLDAALTAAPFSMKWDSSTVADGWYTLTARATDEAGLQTTATPVGILVSNAVSSLGLPTVTVVASAATAMIGTTNDAVVTFARTGGTTQPLTVNFSLGGSAVDGNDYRAIGGVVPVSVTFAAGSSLTNLTIIGLGNSTDANPETAIFTLDANVDYTVGAPSIAIITIVTNSLATLPTVTVTATTPNASRVGLTGGIFTLTRNGSTASPLTVAYSLGGTAVNGVAYSKLATSATIPAGASSTTLSIAPLPSASYVGTEAAVLTLSANAAYNAGAQNNATVSIAGNNVPIWAGKTTRNDMEIVWHSVVGKAYRVAYGTSLSATTWTNLSGLISATSTTTEYIDYTSKNAPARYYVVYVTD